MQKSGIVISLPHALPSHARIVPKIPLDKFLQTCLQIGCGLVPKLFLCQANVRVRELHIPIPRHLQHLLVSFHLQQFLQYTNKLRHRHRRGVPQIEHPQLRRGLLLPPTSNSSPPYPRTPNTP